MYNENQKNATVKYLKENIRQIKLQINIKTEPDLYAWIESKSNKQGYLKELMRADMDKYEKGDYDG